MCMPSPAKGKHFIIYSWVRWRNLLMSEVEKWAQWVESEVVELRCGSFIVACLECAMVYGFTSAYRSAWTHTCSHTYHTHTQSAVLLNPAVLHYLVHVMAVAHTAYSVIVTKLMVLLCSGSWTTWQRMTGGPYRSSSSAPTRSSGRSVSCFSPLHHMLLKAHANVLI